MSIQVVIAIDGSGAILRYHIFEPFKELIGGILSALIYGSLFGSLCDVTNES